jgi:FlaA1/EpsC-like NDP-sugar epimerase
LAKKMIALSGVPADIEFVGLRPGEKLHEELITDLEALLPTEREKIMRVDRVEIPDAELEAEVDRLVESTARGAAGIDLRAAIDRLEPGFFERATNEDRT